MIDDDEITKILQSYPSGHNVTERHQKSLEITINRHNFGHRIQAETKLDLPLGAKNNGGHFSIPAIKVGPELNAAISIHPGRAVRKMNRHRCLKADILILTGCSKLLYPLLCPGIARRIKQKSCQPARISDSDTAMTEGSFFLCKKTGCRSIMKINAVFIGKNKLEAAKSIPGTWILTNRIAFYLLAADLGPVNGRC